MNVFVFISSYYLVSANTRRLSKVASLFLQVIIFNVIIYIMSCVFGSSVLSVKGIAGALVPINYFVVLYSVLYIISPYINILFNNLRKKQQTRLVIIVFVVFSLWSYGVDCLNHVMNYIGSSGTVNGLSPIGMYGSQDGYTIVNFMLIYIIASYIKLNNININRRISLAIYIVTTCLIFALSLIDFTLINYNNPLVILSAISIFFVFKNINIKNNRVINELSKASFTCFLFHLPIIHYLSIEKYANENVIVLLLHQVVSAILIYTASYVVYKIYNFFIKHTLSNLINKLDGFDIYCFGIKDSNN